MGRRDNRGKNPETCFLNVRYKLLGQHRECTPSCPPAVRHCECPRRAEGWRLGQSEGWHSAEKMGQSALARRTKRRQAAELRGRPHRPRAFGEIATPDPLPVQRPRAQARLSSELVCAPSLPTRLLGLPRPLETGSIAKSREGGRRLYSHVAPQWCARPPGDAAGCALESLLSRLVLP